ncbi:MAG: hypothetical protein AAGF01_12510 [Cyanobacteria bacterium P01_G01_bin.38]
MKTKTYSGNARTGRSYRPSVVQWRADTVRLIVLGAALALIIYDAKVSYDGFQKLELGDTHAPLIFAAMIFVTQLGVGLLHALGEDFRDVKAGSDTGFLNSIWGWVLMIIYGVDVASNAVHFGVFGKFGSAPATPVESLGAAGLILGMSVLLTFGDEVLLRVHDKIAIACAKNRVYAKRHGVAVAAHNAYIAATRERQMETAQVAGRKEGDWEFGEGL